MREFTENKEGLASDNGDLAYPVPEDYNIKRADVEYGEVKEILYHSETVGKERRALVVLPPAYTETKKYPVVYLCHGLGQDQTQWLDDGSVQIMLGNMIADGTAKEMILVLPNCRARENDEADPEDAFAITNYRAFDRFLDEFQNDLEPYIGSHFSVASGREHTAIAGFSMGGRVSLHLGFTLPDMFGYIGAFCPAPGIFHYTHMNVTEEGLFTEETFDIKEKYRDHTVLMIVAGESDMLVGGYPEKYHSVLASHGVEHIWYRKQGGHDMKVSGHGLYNFMKNIF